LAAALENSDDELPADAKPAAAEDARVRRPALPSLIGCTVVMKGELIVGEDLVIEGTFDGTITGSGHDSVTVRRIARISGEVSASDVRVEDGTNLQNTILSGRIRLADDKSI
jgi:cytoskeletal protein CcmA (bactofilin family)